MTLRAGLILISLVLLLAPEASALETIRGIVRDGSDIQCAAGCGTYYIEPDAPYLTTMLGGNFRLYLNEHVQITGFRDLCGGCQVLFASQPVIVLPPLSVEGDGPGVIPRETRLGQNYPNPFNPGTSIEYALPSAAQVRLAVCDVLGREVAILVDADMAPGVHRASFSSEGLAGGVYFCRLRVTYSGQDRLITTKMLLAK